ncbi:MAG: PadR family transcriptional regulator [Gemmatimonadota bacterium]
MPSPSGSEPLRGSVDLLILRALELEPSHGWAISNRIQELSQGVLEMNQGSLYPALQRLEQKGWIRASWQQLEEMNRRARVYALTARGQRELARETESWRRYARAMKRVLAAERV